VLEISTQLGKSVVSQVMEDSVVCPAILQRGLFPTSAVDNIDHNPFATTATTSFHGTGISVFFSIQFRQHSLIPERFNSKAKSQSQELSAVSPKHTQM